MKIKNSLRGLMEFMLLSPIEGSEFACYNDGQGSKTLWRLSHGSRSKAIEIVKKFAKSQPHVIFEWDDWEFDNVVAEIMGGGCEVEWVSE